MTVSVARAVPAPLTPVLGREQEAARLARLLLGGARLVTLVGPGGIGKTVLAQNVARALQGQFDLGAVLVELAPLRHPESVLEAVAAALRVDRALLRDLATLSDEIGDQSVLLVLDNFEHLRAAAPDVLALLRALPRASVLVTSRLPLRVGGELEFPVAPLALAPSPAQAAASPAVQLFVHAARAVEPPFALTPENAPDVLDICRTLGGVPLALELAASRLRTLALPDLLVRLDRPFALLRSGDRDRPDRLQSLEASATWSYDLLSGRERDVLACCATFVGGFSPDALAAVWGGEDVLHELDSLITLSFVRRLARPAARYTLLEPLRELAADRLDAHPLAQTWRERHAQYFLDYAVDLARRAQAGQETPPESGVEPFTLEHANLLQALEWLIGRQETSRALRFVRAMFMFWFVHGRYREGRRWMERLRTLPPPSASEERLSFVYLDLQWHTAVGETRLVPELCRELQAVAVTCGEPWYEFKARYFPGVNAYRLRRFEEARDLLEAAFVWLGELPADVQDESAFVSERAFAQVSFALVWEALGEADRALPLLEDALTRHLSIDNGFGQTVVLSYLGPLLDRLGERERALRCLLEGLELSVRQEFWGPLANAVQGLASFLSAEGDAEAGVVLASSTRVLRDSTGRLAEPLDRDRYVALLAGLREQVSPENFEAAWRQGARLKPTEVLAFVRERVALRAASAHSPAHEGQALLTPREREVLALVAQGHPDRRIATLLGISPTTASKHVANLLGKLGKRNRVELTRWAVEQGVTAGP